MRLFSLLGSAEGLLMASFDKGLGGDPPTGRLRETQGLGLREYSSLPEEILGSVTIDDLLMLECDNEPFF